MAIETQFTIRSVNVEQALKEAEDKVDRASRKMDDSLSSVGSESRNIEQTLQDAAGGMDAIAQAGGTAGEVLKTVTDAIAGMMSPIGMVSALITGVIALVVSMQEQARQRMQALKDYASGSITDAERKLAETQQELASDRDYMQRLNEINHYEQIDNATKEEAIRIISLLASRYGDLGVSIDQTTGKMIGLDGAMDEFNRKQLQNESAMHQLLISEHKGLVDVQDAELKKQMQGGILTPQHVATLETWSPMTPEEREEQLSSQRAKTSYGRMGLTPPPDKVATPLNDERAIRAARRERRYYATDHSAIRGYAEAENDKALIELLDYHAQLGKMMGDPATSSQDIELYRQEIGYVDQLVQAFNRAKVAEEMMDATKEDPEIMQAWKERRDAAMEYYGSLKKGAEIVSMLRSDKADPRDKVIADRGKEAQALLQQMRDAEQMRASTLDKQYETETANERATMSEAQLQEAYEIDRANVLDQMEHESQELEVLRQEYDDMTEQIKEYERYKDKSGDIRDKAQNAAYLELSNKITANKLAQVEAETRIAEAQTEQLGIQAKLKALQEKRIKEQRGKIVTQLKTTMEGLVSNMLGGMRERTDSLAQRGGYIGKTTNINPFRINQQILSATLTTNNYLHRIQQLVGKAGEI